MRLTQLRFHGEPNLIVLHVDQIQNCYCAPTDRKAIVVGWLWHLVWRLVIGPFCGQVLMAWSGSSSAQSRAFRKFCGVLRSCIYSDQLLNDYFLALAPTSWAIRLLQPSSLGPRRVLAPSSFSFKNLIMVGNSKAGPPIWGKKKNRSMLQ